MRHALAVLLTCVVLAPAAAGPKKVPVVLDTDIGSDIDDAFALGLAVGSPEFEILAVTTVGGGNDFDPFVGQRKDRDDHRAWLVCRFLTQVGVKDVPVAAGDDPQPKAPIDWQIQYRRHPAAIYNRTRKPEKESATELMARVLKDREDVTLVAIGPLTNVARFLKDYPKETWRIGRIVLMGGSIAVGYDGKPKPEPEWNIKSDVAAAKAVFASNIPLVVVPLDVTSTLRLEKRNRDSIFNAHTPLSWQVQNLYELWDQETPILFDPVAVAAAMGWREIVFKELRLEVNDAGMTVVKEGKPNARVALGLDAEVFLIHFVERLRSSGQPTLPKPPGNPSKLIDPGRFPARVHTFEDYDTDIEKRWWMCGKLEAKDAPAPGGRACRAVLTQDFDDKQGDAGTMYRAVIFNPVPGPPMGPNTRLRFKYKLTGTDTIRVQLYSLTHGYHRYLSVCGLEQNKWLDGCVDMTQLQRPDGTNRGLGENERIDDIQFYVDPRAELLIDDVVLHDAAKEGETRPFPRRVHFTGWFDTGKQGKEWPGDFAVVDHEKPRAWKAAKSVPGPDGKPWLRIDIRGERALDAKTELAFKYKVAEPTEVTIELYNRGEKKVLAGHTVKLPKAEWAEITVPFGPPAGTTVDEIRVRLPSGELLLDDVLLYTPG
jgi:inosine-uridine nucleoside N-ribohydrolase